MEAPKITPALFKETHFCVAVMGRKQGAIVVNGWNDLIAEVEKIFYGYKPSLQDRVVIVKDLSNWVEWVPDRLGVPFHKMTQTDDDKTFVEIFRITHAHILTKPTETVQ